MAQKTTNTNPPSLRFLAIQEVAWALGVVAMILYAFGHGTDWVWIGLLTLWQASIIWGFIKFRQARAS
ncbi:hypothetical protein [Arthrobacter sp. EpRS71]|uniref:hypothetical protein n=1 Tax=Arthrobacter sp. EpRS71 TaxID=1743141 RepID=UPI00074632F3|nr:hypothetical protein [Arthrobacter sp. EpRS71]KUM40805.1 hypothetical protein AR689_05420 [Arthrobacter sp. EpRS71]